MKSLQQDYNSFLCSSLLMLSSAVFLMGDDRKHLQTLCGHCHEAVPSQGDPAGPQNGPGTIFAQEKLSSSKTQLHRGSFARAPNLLHKYLLLL